MCSGGGVSKLMKTSTPQKKNAFWTRVIKNAGCESIDQLKLVDVKKYFEAWEQTKKELKGMHMPSPVIDGNYVVAQGVDLLKAKKHHQIPYICGSTSEDMIPPILFNMAKSWCKKQEVDSYIYYFERQLPGDNNGAWHSSDLWYWFGTLKNAWRPFEKRDEELSHQMTDYLCNFAKTGNPNGDGLPSWETKKVLCFKDDKTSIGKPCIFKQIKTMLTNKAVGE
jgi:para-nitrobenzyl esterase